MNEQLRDSFEERSRVLFHDSVEGLDFALRSRLTQARKAAIDAASASRPAWFFRIGVLAPAGVAAAAILGAFLERIMGSLVHHQTSPSCSRRVCTARE